MKKWIFVIMVCVLSIPLISSEQSYGARQSASGPGYSTNEPVGLKEFKAMTEKVYDALVNVPYLESSRRKGRIRPEEEAQLKELQNAAKGFVVVLYRKDGCPHCADCITALTNEDSNQNSLVSRLKKHGVRFYELTFARDKAQFDTRFYANYMAVDWTKGGEPRRTVVAPALLLFKDGIYNGIIMGSDKTEGCSENSPRLQELEDFIIQHR